MRRNIRYTISLLIWPTICLVMLYIFFWSPGVRQSRLLYSLTKASSELNGMLHNDVRFAHIDSAPANPFADSHLLIMGNVHTSDDYQSLRNAVDAYVDKRYRVRYAVQIFNATYERMRDRVDIVPNV